MNSPRTSYQSVAYFYLGLFTCFMLLTSQMSYGAVFSIIDCITEECSDLRRFAMFISKFIISSSADLYSLETRPHSSVQISPHPGSLFIPKLCDF